MGRRSQRSRSHRRRHVLQPYDLIPSRSDADIRDRRLYQLLNPIEILSCRRRQIVQLARLVGRENVMAGSDCGFGTAAGMATVDPKITWAKFAAMSEGARLATQALRVPVHA